MLHRATPSGSEGATMIRTVIQFSATVRPPSRDRIATGVWVDTAYRSYIVRITAGWCGMPRKPRVDVAWRLRGFTLAEVIDWRAARLETILEALAAGAERGDVVEVLDSSGRPMWRFREGRKPEPLGRRRAVEEMFGT